MARSNELPQNAKWLRCLRVLTAVIAVIVLVVCGGIWGFWSEESRAKRALIRGRFSDARTILGRLLWLTPKNPRLCLMMAESISRDDTLVARSHTIRAIELLGRISDSSSEAREARIREARLLFLLLHQPIAAEKSLRRAITIQPNAVEAYALLWPLLDMTGRMDYSEPLFQMLIQLQPASERLPILKEWFFSQNDPTTFTSILDERMGFRELSVNSGRRVELNRLVEFRRLEPHEPVTHAAVARWFLTDGDIEQARKVIDEGLRISTALENEFFLSVMIGVLIESGELELAASQFSRWKPCERHDYWKLKGQLEEHLRCDYLAAAKSYEKAIDLWPGAADWKCQFRYAACLALNNEKERAEAVRKHALEVQALFKPTHQQRLKEALKSPQKPDNRAIILEFYRVLGRDDEVHLWNDVVVN